MKTQMPKINLTSETEEEQEILNLITNKGCLRATKPPVPRKVKTGHPNEFNINHYDYATAEDALRGKAAYVWRMAAFEISPHSAHHCMPVTATFDLPGWAEEARVEAKCLDRLVNRIVNSVPKSEWHGIQRWGQAFGVIGEPCAAEDGAIVYR